MTAEVRSSQPSIQPSILVHQQTEKDRIQRSACRSKEKQRINNLKILQFDNKDRDLIQSTKSHVDSFLTAIGLKLSISTEHILQALQQAHIASDEYYNVTHAQRWNTTFVFPVDAIAKDVALFDSCSNDFTVMCKTKQERLAHNRMSLRRIIETFGPLGTRIPGMLLSDFLHYASSPPTV